jgi:hypothetical protein
MDTRLTDTATLQLEALRLQNGYALAIDHRDWALFRELFTPTVQAVYAGKPYDGVEEWLADFVPFHDTCEWTLHVMTNHVVGEDATGPWAACYGWVQWTYRDTPALMNHTAVVYRDRLEEHDGGWRIGRRDLTVLKSEPAVPVPAGLSLPVSVRDLAFPLAP